MKLFTVVVLMALCHPAFSKVISSPSEDQKDQIVQEVANDRPVLAKRNGIGHCYANGDPHYQTFDGKYYNFMGTCRYVQLTDYCNYGGGKGPLGEFKVIVENVNCGRSVSCINSAEVVIGGESIHLRRGTTSPATTHRPMYSVTVEGGYVVVRTKPAGLTVKWDMSMILTIDLDERYRGKVCGMCGNFDGNQGNDFTMSSGAITGDVNTFGQSWQSGGKCGKPVTPQHPCDTNPHRRAEAIKDCSVIKSYHFQACKAAMDLQVMYDNCVYDVCAGTSVTMADSSCEAIKAASLMCKDKTGQAMSWGHLENKCSCQKKATVHGRTECCHFPFEYKGVTFYDCVPQVTIGKGPWCSTAPKASWRTVGECI